MEQTINKTVDTRRFLVVNTVEYNEDGKYTVQDTDFEGLEGLGFDPEELTLIDTIGIGRMLGGDGEFAPYEGVYVMRVA